MRNAVKFVSAVGLFMGALPVLAIGPNGIVSDHEYSFSPTHVEAPVAGQEQIVAHMEVHDFYGDEATKDLDIRWTSIYNIDWCLNVVVTIPDYTVLGGGISGTICDGCDGENLRIDSADRTGEGVFELRATYVGDGSCAESMCGIAFKSGKDYAADYGWNGACDSFPADGVLNGCVF